MVQQVSGLLMRLNMTTRRWHAAVDEPWLSLLRPDVGRSDYRATLVRAYGFIAPFEAACKYTPSLARHLDMHGFSRAGLIAQDLLHLGMSPSDMSAIPQCGSISIFRDVPEALGWVYVVERATLLQDGIRRHVLHALPELHDACAYLAAFEGRVSERWNAFARVLDRNGSNEKVASSILDAAQASFAILHAWFGPTVRSTCGETRDI